ncbi:hypothetical protein ACWGHU_10365 [Streptomyces xanthophaeus]
MKPQSVIASIDGHQVCGAVRRAPRSTCLPTLYGARTYQVKGLCDR